MSGFKRKIAYKAFFQNAIDDQQGHPGWCPDYLRESEWLYPSRCL
jgi:hypothetical protein